MSINRTKDPLRPLRRDVRLLEMQLRQVLRRFGSEALVERISRLRELARQHRQDEPVPAALVEAVEGLSDDDREALVRTLMTYFDLVNLAEDRHRIRVLRQRSRDAYPGPRQESVGDAVRLMRSWKMSDADIARRLTNLRIEPVFTAHPTEAKRKTVRGTLGRIRDDLMELDNRQLLRSERAALLRRIRADIDCLWETESLRPAPPTVTDEVERTLDYADTLWQVTPTLIEEARAALDEPYASRVPSFLRFASWVGGDRDGNPFVTVDVTRQTLERTHQLALDRHIAETNRLFKLLTISDRYHEVGRELADSLEEAGRRWPRVLDDIRRISPRSRYRQYLAVIRRRLTEALDDQLRRPDSTLGYTRPAELLEDVRRVQRSLADNGHDALAEQVQHWIDRIETFGFHLLALDIRINAADLNTAVHELAEASGLTDGRNRADVDWHALLGGELTREQVAGVRTDRLSPETVEMVCLFDLVHEVSAWSPGALGCMVLSMTHTADDVLAALWLMRRAALLAGDDQPAPMPIVPLFETVADLQHARDIMSKLLDVTVYRQHLNRNDGRQICMVGYSDSTKDGGYLAANWSLYEAQHQLAAFAAENQITIDIFHGRGGSIGRGGGPAARAVLALPHNSVHGRMRLTEQGEVLAERYDNRHIAHRHLEQLTWATLLASATPDQPVEPRWRQVISEASQTAQRTYRDLIEQPAFIDYFRRATPIDQIETLPIGSRPSRRRGIASLDDLRAIPYTFAWTQSRQVLTGFYGMGTALQPLVDSDLELLRTMYQRWPFFRAVIDNAELGLIRFDGAIAERYAQLAGDNAADVHQRIVEEFALAEAAVLAIKQVDVLAEAQPWLRAAFQRRNPDVDLLNLVQCDLLKRCRTLDLEPTSELSLAARQTIQAIASGLRTTG